MCWSTNYFDTIISSASRFQLIRQIIACITTIYHVTNSTTDSENNSCLKQKPSSVVKDTRADKNKKEAEIFEDISWRPWDLIWPKENNKSGSLPVCNSYGKYGVKLFWMVSYSLWWKSLKYFDVEQNNVSQKCNGKKYFELISMFNSLSASVALI